MHIKKLNGNKNSAVAEMGDVWRQQTWAEKWGAAVPLSVAELGHHPTQRDLRKGLPLYQVAS